MKAVTGCYPNQDRMHKGSIGCIQLRWANNCPSEDSGRLVALRLKSTKVFGVIHSYLIANFPKIQLHSAFPVLINPHDTPLIKKNITNLILQKRRIRHKGFVTWQRPQNAEVEFKRPCFSVQGSTWDCI